MSRIISVLATDPIIISIKILPFFAIVSVGIDLFCFLQRMTSTLSKLESLDISDCEHITDTGVRDVSFNCRMMRTLLLANCHQVTDEGTRFISQACPYIAQLDLSGCNIT